MRKALLSSGGMDSFLLAHEPELAGAQHVFVDVRQAYRDKEVEAARYVAASVGAELHVVKTINLAQFEHVPTGIIPFRNAELILCAAQYAEALYLGVIADEVNSDKSPEFLAAMTQVLNISHRGQYWTEGREFELRTPFREYTKTQLVTRYLERGGSLPHLLKSVSCYDAGAMHCGRCSSCFKRWVALTNALGHDAEERCEPYGVHPALHHGLAHWRTKLASYPPNRLAEVERAYAIAKKGLVE